MHKEVLDNGIKLIYSNGEGRLTSFTIGFEAGAFSEDVSEIGAAHALEHVLYKGTKKLSEEEINYKLDNLFGFNNAMTNYPYVIFYGTSLSEDFTEGFKLLTDIIINPSFPKESFKEEIKVILEELNEWKDDPYQNCEDSLFFNCFKNRRLKETIIGNEESIRSLNIEKLQTFYEKNYGTDNCVVSVVSSLPYDYIKETVEEVFLNFKKKTSKRSEIFYEKNIPGVYSSVKNGASSAKIQVCFDIKGLSLKDKAALMIFNSAFGEGTSSVLYNNIRTLRGLSYEVGSKLSFEKGIELLNIYMGTSTDKVPSALTILNLEIAKLRDYNTFKDIFTLPYVRSLIKRLRLKEELRGEKSIFLSNNFAVNEIMFESFDRNEELLNLMPGLCLYDIYKAYVDILKDKSIQIV